MTPLLRLLVLPLFIALAAGCDDEQVLYRTQSPEPIPPAPSTPQPPAVLAGAAAAAPGAPAIGALPDPTPADFVVPTGVEYGPAVDMAGLLVPVPARWLREQPASASRVAQYRAGESGEFVAFHFGVGQGGSAEDNIRRWAGQFQPLAGESTPLRALQQAPGADGLAITRVLLLGNYNAGMMTADGKAAPPRDNWALDALIVEGGPRGSVFLRLTGPADFVAASGPAMEGIAAQIRAGGAVAANAVAATPVVATPAMPSAPASSAVVVTPEGWALVVAPGITFAVPADWERGNPSAGMRLAEFRLPGGGEAVVFHFGTAGGGPRQANIDRWVNQFRPNDGQPAARAARVETRTAEGLTISRVAIEGTYTPTAMSPTAPPSPSQPGWALRGFIIEGGPQGPVYLRLTGPEALLAGMDEVLAALEATIHREG